MGDNAVRRQYATSQPLDVRIDTHARYSERPDDLDAACAPLLALTGDEAILDAGPGPGRFELYLRARGRHGPFTGLDQSRTMAVEARTTLAAAGHTAAWLARDVPRRLAAKGGLWRDPKSGGIYVCYAQK